MLLLIINSNFAQEINYLSSFGEFSLASSFDIDLKGNFYITDINDHTITKLDSLGHELISIGGYGWEEASFDEPINIITNTLSVYVADKNNNRVQRFDKDLNFLSEFNGDNEESDIEFGYPTCLSISNIGDLFILESDNNRILKFNLTGEYLLDIGANDAGSFALANPKYFSSDLEGNLFILDENSIKVIDQYGNGLFSYKLQFEPNKIKNIEEKILYVGDSLIVIYDLKERKEIVQISDFPKIEDIEIIDVNILGSNLYVLTPNRIFKYYFHY